MASTYALPIAPATNTHSHGRTRSQYAPEATPHANEAMNGSSPARSNGAHRHSHSEMNGHGQLHGAVRSPYAEYNGTAHEHDHGHAHSHSHSHSHSQSNDSAYTIKPFMNGRSNGGTRGELGFGQSPQRKGASAKRYGFSPIQETVAHPPPAVSSSWLELPEALTALLITLPYLFTTVAFPGVPGPVSRTPTTLSEAVADSSPPIETSHTLRGSPLQQALALSAATLVAVGAVGKVSFTTQPLDRRKEAAGYGDTKSTLKRAVKDALGVILPFYAAAQLGGAKAALVLLLCLAAGVGSVELKPGKHTFWNNLQRTVRTRKFTSGALIVGTIVDCFAATFSADTLLGYGALWTSIMLVPPPLPTSVTSLSIKSTSSADDSFSQSRATLPRPASSLVNSAENIIATILSGFFLTVVFSLYSCFSAPALPQTLFAKLFFVLSVASATALYVYSLPLSLKNTKLNGVKLGGLLVAAFGFWERFDTSGHALVFLWTCVVSVGAVVFDLKSPKLSGSHSHDHSHGHSHAGHKHSHDHDHGHHLHGNHSRISAFLIARSTPGSIIHSVLIERDSRRIAYFGVLNLSFMMVQFFYGFVSGSLGLLTDSIHMLFDCAGLAVGLAAAVMSKWRPNARFPYGYGKIDTLSGFANGVFLLLVSVEIIFDAFERLWEGHELQRLNELLIVSVLGFLVNIVGLTAFGHAHHGHGHSHDHGDHDHGHGHSHSHDNENMQGIFLHILADALGSVAVIVSTLLTKYYGWSGWDPIASCIIAVLIFLSAIPLVKSSGARLMLSLPNDIEYGVRNTLGELGTLRGVVGYTVPKFWLEDEGAAHAEAHAKEEHDCDHGHGHDHSHDHSHSHSHSHSPSHSNSHDHHHHGHSHDHHGHDHHDHDHDHDHSHAAHKQRILGVIHIIANRSADLEDVRERTVQFLKGRGMDVVVHVEHEGEVRCWCGGGTKTN